MLKFMACFFSHVYTPAGRFVVFIKSLRQLKIDNTHTEILFTAEIIWRQLI